jgi:deoxyinosine 3'endonuclease (endonuclease V)
VTIVLVEGEAMTNRRKLGLAVAVLAIAVFAMSPLVGAAHTRAYLAALSETAEVGSTIPLGVHVAPTLVGGTGDLFVTSENGETLGLGTFALKSATFVLQAPVPATAGQAGETLTYFFRSYGVVGAEATVVSNGAVVMLMEPGSTDEPPIWE